MYVSNRPVCGIRGRTVIINLPGSKKASQVGADVVLDADNNHACISKLF